MDQSDNFQENVGSSEFFWKNVKFSVWFLPAMDQNDIFKSKILGQKQL